MLIFVIKDIREKENISLYKLSKITGISRTYLRNLENNKRHTPNVAVLEKIATILKVNIKDLFFSTLDISKLKKKMYYKINKYGINSEQVLEISRIIDLLVNIDMHKKR